MLNVLIFVCKRNSSFNSEPQMYQGCFKARQEHNHHQGCGSHSHEFMKIGKRKAFAKLDNDPNRYLLQLLDYYPRFINRYKRPKYQLLEEHRRSSVNIRILNLFLNYVACDILKRRKATAHQENL